MPASLERTFAPFRSSPEALPARVTQTAEGPTGGINRRLAQRLPTADSAALWAVPGRTLLCLVQQTTDGAVSASCTPIARAIEHGVVLTSLAAKPGKSATANRTVVGLVPDGTRRVRIETPGFASATSPVTDNMFTARDTIADPPERVTLLR